MAAVPTSQAMAGVKKIYVLDCGGQYAHLIASRVRKHEALSVIVAADTPASELVDAGAVIVSGGPQSVYDPESLTVDTAVWDMPCPVLGICYGMQLMCQNLGGKVEEAQSGEYGRAKLSVVNPDSVLFKGVDAQSDAWMSHRDRVIAVPEGFAATGTTDHCPFASCECLERQMYGLQFHPEVTHSVFGETILGNFIESAGLKGSWRMDNFIEEQVAAIQAKCEGGRKVFVLVSGGVDSSVTFALLTKALGVDRVLGLFVDTGMMRKDEGSMVETELQKTFPGANLHYVKAEDEFLAALAGETAPEKKRRIIGQKFLDVQKVKVAEFGLNPEEWLLGQGTIYPDTIESGGKKKGSKQVAEVIKTHHNRVPEIEALIEAGLVIEPCADLYKDEVRAVGEKLGLPGFMVWRHPFPGPGLGVRLLCHPGGAVADDTIDLAALAENETAIKGMIGEGATAKIPLMKSVGVQGDSRTYKHFAIIGGAYPKDWLALDELATKIINTQGCVNRVTASLCFNEAGCDAPAYDVHTKAATCTRDRFETLREADAVVHQELAAADLMASVWQCPVAMAPLATSSDGTDECVILRPVTSTEAMTAEFSRLPWEVVSKIATRIKAEVPGVLDVLYDITNKPPGTIEWE